MARLFEIIRPPVTQLTQDALWTEWQLWFQRVFDYIENAVLRTATSGDAAATIKIGEGYHGVTAISAARVLTLPLVASLEDGYTIVVQDESGSASGGNTITVTAAGSDTINGGTTAVISSAYGRVTLIKSGTAAWYSA